MLSVLIDHHCQSSLSSSYSNATRNNANERLYFQGESLQNLSNDRHPIKNTLSVFQAFSPLYSNFKAITEIGQFSLNTFVPIVRQIVTALIELHTSDVMHLNLNSNNILVDPDLKSAKLINANILRSAGGDPRFIAPE